MNRSEKLLGSMETESKRAGVLAVGYRLGFVSKSEIIEWADAAILETDSPIPEIIDLALMSKAHPEDILKKLREIDPEKTAIEALPEVLAFYASYLRANPQKGPEVSKGLWSIYVEAGYDVPATLNPIASFDDDYYLAKNKTYGTEQQVFERLLAFFESFVKAA